MLSEFLNRLFRTGDFFMEKQEPNKRSLFHKEIGEIVYTKVRKSRTIRIVVSPSKPVKVTLPYHCSYEEADRLVYEKIDWIKGEQANMKALEANRKVFSEEEVERLREQAKRFLPPRVEILARRYGFTYNKIILKNIRSRWGSCSHVNNLNFSIYLMYLPDELVDYVILHELCHTVHKNHGTHFWELMDGITDGKAKELAAQMREHGNRIF